jgi:hypothetical protein
MHLVGFTIEIYHDAWTYERQNSSVVFLTSVHITIVIYHLGILCTVYVLTSFVMCGCVYVCGFCTATE